MSLLPNAEQKSRINQVLFAIHSDLSAAWTANNLAEIAAYSPHHFHRVFKAVTGENLNIYLRRTRLEKASNLLIFHRHQTVLEVAQRCGFNSPASFTHRFKEWFGTTPKAWREGGYEGFAQRVADDQADDEIALPLRSPLSIPDTPSVPHDSSIKEISTQPAFSFKDVQLIQRDPTRVAYVRHQGYDRSIGLAWRKVLQWMDEEGLPYTESDMIGLYHSNPSIVPLPECRYVACIAVPDTVWRRGEVGIMTIPGGLHAKLQVSGRYGELLPVLHWLLHDWLPQSGYHMALTPAFVCYQRNQFIQSDEQFELDLCLPLASS